MRRLNINETIYFMVLSIFCLLFFYLFNTGKILLFINPQMVKYSKFAFAFLIILLIFQFSKLYNPRNRGKIRFSFLLLLLPVILGFTLASKGITYEAASKKGVNYWDNGANGIETDSKVLLRREEITFTDKNYYEYISEISKAPNKFKGKGITIEGFVFKEDGFNKDEFVVARMLMTCCAADAQVTGFFSKYNEAYNLKSNTYVKVIGTLDYTEYQSKTGKRSSILPMIQVKQVIPINNPINQYIYP